MAKQILYGKHYLIKDGVTYRIDNNTLEIDMTKTVITVDDLTKTESSNVSSVAYQEKDKTVFITFSNGGLYKYEGVEKEDYETLRDAESVGRHLRAVFLKKGFEYEKLVDTEILGPAVLTEEVIEEAAKKVEDDFGKV